ncbi:MAG: IS1182 family transposase [Acidimicrobiales bacterium]
MQGTSDPNAELLDAAALCRHLVPEDSVHAFLADHRRGLFPDDMFADLFPSGRGRPSVPADVVATVMVLQSLEGLSDRDAAMALRTNIMWKVAAGRALDDGGIHYSVLTYWRSRLRASQSPERIFDAVRAVIDATGVLAGKRRRALDSTLLDDAVATQDTVTQLVSAIRRVRRLVPEAAAVTVAAHHYDASGKPVCAWDDPDAKAALVSGLVNDARAIIDALAGVELDDGQGDAVGLLALVAGQDVEPGDDDGTWRIARRVAPDRVISTVDPESRHMHKSVSVYRDGYKAHVAVEPETGLITATALTPANAGDGPTGLVLLAGEAPGLQVLADSAYGSGDVRAALHEAGHTTAIKAIPMHRNHRLGPDQFNRDDFVIDHTSRTVTCPAGHTVAITTSSKAGFGTRCRACPLRSRCTTAAEGRIVTIHPHDIELAAARKAWNNGDFADDYQQHRPMVERSIAWLVAKGNRRVRYRGVERNQHGLAARVAAINLRRLVNLGLHNTETGWALA